MSQALRKLTGAINNSKTSVVFTNQLREKVGVMFGIPETTPGGRALKFYASVRLDIRRIESIKVGTEVVGSRARVKVVKNKVAAPFRVAEFDIMFNEGISREGGLIDVGLEMGIIKKAGAFFSVGDIRLGQGRENAKEYPAAERRCRRRHRGADSARRSLRRWRSPKKRTTRPRKKTKRASTVLVLCSLAPLPFRGGAGGEGRPTTTISTDVFLAHQPGALVAQLLHDLLPDSPSSAICLSVTTTRAHSPACCW